MMGDQGSTAITTIIITTTITNITPIPPTTTTLAIPTPIATLTTTNTTIITITILRTVPNPRIIASTIITVNNLVHRVGCTFHTITEEAVIIIIITNNNDDNKRRRKTMVAAAESRSVYLPICPSVRLCKLSLDRSELFASSTNISPFFRFLSMPPMSLCTHERSFSPGPL
ncbi:hypothetical protein FRC14_004393 [Serendipita sp. 396]|nr:hypothetical protein FRC14_004393 [Serendipita sp. 396]